MNIFLDENFYFRGCGWKPIKVKWSVEDLNWMAQTTTLLYCIFGPDKFVFNTKNKSAAVHENSQPELAYNHCIWEENYQENTTINAVPKKTCERQTRKSNTKPKAQCSLEINYFSTNGRPKQVPVPEWGDVANLDDGIQIKLINTCPIDNYLTIFYLYFKAHQPMEQHELCQTISSSHLLHSTKENLLLVKLIG